jgi:MULE transposase domain
VESILTELQAAYRRQSLIKYRDVIVAQLQQGVRTGTISAGLREYGLSSRQTPLFTIAPSLNLDTFFPSDPCHSEYAGISKLAHSLLVDTILSTGSRSQLSSWGPGRDIYNLRTSLRLEFLAGRTPTQALVSTLSESGDWRLMYEEEDNRILSVFGMHKTSIQMLQRNPWVLVLDCTHQTNRYKMPTLNISGMATTGKSFFVGFGLAPNEQQDSYQFVLNALRKAYLDLNLSRAETPITDNNNSPIKEIKVFSPAAHIALRIWH